MTKTPKEELEEFSVAVLKYQTSIMRKEMK